MILLTCLSHTVNKGKLCPLNFSFAFTIVPLKKAEKDLPLQLLSRTAKETKRMKYKTFEVILPRRFKPSPNARNNMANLCNNLNLAVHLSFKACAVKLIQSSARSFPDGHPQLLPPGYINIPCLKLSIKSPACYQ